MHFGIMSFRLRHVGVQIVKRSVALLSYILDLVKAVLKVPLVGYQAFIKGDISFERVIQIMLCAVNEKLLKVLTIALLTGGYFRESA